MRIAICDDQPQELAILQAMLAQYSAEKGVTLQVFSYSDGESLLYDIQEKGNDYSLLLLDVLMAGITGIETADRLRRSGCQTPLAFLTTTRDYAVESYSVGAEDYLLKPVQKERLWALLDKLLDKLDRPFLTLHVHGSVYNCFYNDILYFESLSHLIYLHTNTGNTLRCTETLAAIEAALADDPRFYRCHKSYLINLDCVDHVDDTFVLMDGSRIPYRIREKKKITDDYYKYFIKRSLTNKVAEMA